VALINPADIIRHKQFKQDVDDLMGYGHIRHYTAEIKGRTGESTGNIANYYNGDKPIGDNFLKKFHKAYGHKLKEIRESPDSNAPKLAVNTIAQQAQVDYTDMPPNTDTTPSLVEEPGYHSDFQKIVIEKLTSIEQAIARMEQEKIRQSKTNPKKK